MRLQTLEGHRLSWSQLHALNERYWATHERDGSLRLPLPRVVSSACHYKKGKGHLKCSGYATHQSVMCGCPCHA